MGFESSSYSISSSLSEDISISLIIVPICIKIYKKKNKLIIKKKKKIIIKYNIKYNIYKLIKKKKNL